MSKNLINRKANFGVMPVFMTAISTILGAILFLRFGYAVGNIGFIGVLGIVVLGHLITIPTALAVSEIATNQKVQGGGAYYIISRSFGLNIGASIGIALYLSQAISVAFYVIAFAEAFSPLIEYIQHKWQVVIPDNRLISIPTMIFIAILMLSRGANIGMKALYLVVAVLFTSILIFFLGDADGGNNEIILNSQIDNPDSFFYVFVIIFPAFTGLAAGLGLSGDLKDPAKSIPSGTIWATVVGLIVYCAVAYKLAISATPEDLASDQLIMQKIALWGPIIPIGLASASLSSALGSVMVAPRTLQAIGLDKIFPNRFFNYWIAKGKPISNEPVNSSVITIVIALFFVIIGDIDSVAKIISMFFMVTYGAICLISFLEHFAADPSYRPTFKSKWYLSFVGAVLSFWVMFKMNTPYAAVSLIIMALIYIMVSNNGERKGLEKLFRGVVFQLSRQLQVFAQRADKERLDTHWRPFTICISKDSFKRRSAFDMLRWISLKYGFGTYIHFIEGFLNQETNKESKNILDKLIKLAAGSKNRVYLDTIISPSLTSAIAQVIQLSGISGKGNNMILFEFSKTEPDSLIEPLKNFKLLESTEFDICILCTSYKGFGYKKEIHVWITSEDYENANLMILLAYIILGHPEWWNGIIKIFAIYMEDELESRGQNIHDLIRSGRLPISHSNVNLIPISPQKSKKEIIEEKSSDADLTIIGFRIERVKDRGIDLFNRYDNLGNTLFVHSNREKEIK